VPNDGFAQNDLLAKSMAKNMAVKAGVGLNNDERENLINQLFACKEPTVSPTNKAVFFLLETQDFDKKFM
jgi:DNA mismatch repair protein MutL